MKTCRFITDAMKMLAEVFVHGKFYSATTVLAGLPLNWNYLFQADVTRKND